MATGYTNFSSDSLNYARNSNDHRFLKKPTKLHAILSHSGKKLHIIKIAARNLVSPASQLRTGFTRRWKPASSEDFSLGNVFAS